MNSKIRNIALFVSTVFVLLSCAGESKTTPNKDKAEEMFQRVWELYRVPKYGLFSEYYPSSHRPDLTYFNDSTRQAQEVSYLWPMSGVFFFGSVDGYHRTGEIYGLCRFDGDGDGALL